MQKSLSLRGRTAPVGSEPSAASGRRSEVSEWPRSKFQAPAVRQRRNFGHRNRGIRTPLRGQPFRRFAPPCPYTGEAFLLAPLRKGKSPKRRQWRMQQGDFEEVPRLAATTVAGNRLARRWAGWHGEAVTEGSTVPHPLQHTKRRREGTPPYAYMRAGASGAPRTPPPTKFYR